MDISHTLADWPVTLPALAPGETLYSWCGTFHRRAFTGNVLATSRLLFGANYAALLHDFPARLDELERRTQGVIGSAREIARQHTLLGYFLPFLDAERAKAILSGVTVRSVPDLKMRLGIPASGVGGYHPLRCCPECIENDKATLGWPVWHVEHQAPSALVCTRHGRPLVQTWHRASPVHQREWLIPDASPASDRHEIRLPNSDVQKPLHQLADLSARLFSVEPGLWHQAKLTAVYRRWANDHGAITKSGSLRHSTFEAAIGPRFNHLRDAFLAQSPMPIELCLETIIGSAIRNSPKPIHPLKHLVLLIAMFGDAAAAMAALDQEEVDDPDSRMAEHIRGSSEEDGAGEQPPDKEAVFLAFVEQGRSIRAGAAAAGVSTGTGVRWARQHGIAFTPRRKLMHAAVVENIRADLKSGLDRTAVAANHGVSLASINRLLSTEHDLRDAWSRVRHEAAREKNRACLLGLIDSQPTISASQLRKTPGSGWTWLYRHDKAWLETTLPALWIRLPDNPKEQTTG